MSLRDAEIENSYFLNNVQPYYFYNELFLLAFSHDEVVHGKATILQKMWGDYEQKFPQARAFYAYFYTHPGKKLSFMGNEFGQFKEWNYSEGLEFFMLQYPLHNHPQNNHNLLLGSSLCFQSRNHLSQTDSRYPCRRNLCHSRGSFRNYLRRS